MSIFTKMGPIVAMVGVSLLALSPSAYAQAVDVKQNMKTLVEMALMVAPFLGFLVFASGIIQFYKHAKTKDERYGVASSVFKLLAGVLLISINWFYGVLASSFVPNTTTGADNARMMLAVDGQMAQGAAVTMAGGVIPVDTINALLGFIAFVGVLAFLNGLLALKNMGDGRHDERDLYKAITRIAGGIVCLNIKFFGCFIGSIFGVSMLCT
jgi:hypothetical protein